MKMQARQATNNNQPALHKISVGRKSVPLGTELGSNAMHLHYKLTSDLGENGAMLSSAGTKCNARLPVVRRHTYAEARAA